VIVFSKPSFELDTLLSFMELSLLNFFNQHDMFYYGVIPNVY